jgi:hypothetical protein
MLAPDCGNGYNPKMGRELMSDACERERCAFCGVTTPAIVALS